MSNDDRDFYYNAQGFVYIGDEWVLDIRAIWDGIDRLEARGISLERIARRLNEDFETSILALARIGARRS